MSLKLGENEYMSNAAYHGDTEFISSSGLKVALKDPRQYYQQYVLGNKPPMKNQDALLLGTLVHTYCLEPENIQEEFVICGDRKGTKAYKETAARAKEEGKELVSEMMAMEAKHFADQILADKEAAALLRDCEPEKTFCAEFMGLKIKVRADAFSAAGISDIKTTSQPTDPTNFMATIDNYMYDLSAALYVDVIKECTGKEYPFYFIALNKKEAKVDVYKASLGLIEAGRRKYSDAIQSIVENRKSNWAFCIREIGPEIYSTGDSLI